MVYMRRTKRACVKPIIWNENGRTVKYDFYEYFTIQNVFMIPWQGYYAGHYDIFNALQNKTGQNSETEDFFKEM